MDALYHYTDLNAFLSIIQNKKLWLTGAHNLNDHQEINWTINKIRKKLSEIEIKHGRNRAEEIWLLLNHSAAVPYICSLSSEPDLLSQWRAYGKDGTGVSIGFKKSALPISEHLPTMTAALKNSTSLQQIIYDEKNQDAMIDQLLAPALAAGEVDDAAHLAMSMAASNLRGLSSIFKNAAFYEEKEWRIIHIPMIMGKQNSNEAKILLSISPPKYRVTASKLITYFEYAFQADESEVFAELILGPKCELSSYDLSILLTERGLENLPVRRSSASYR